MRAIYNQKIPKEHMLPCLQVGLIPQTPQILTFFWGGGADLQQFVKPDPAVSGTVAVPLWWAKLGRHSKHLAVCLSDCLKMFLDISRLQGCTASDVHGFEESVDLST